MTSEWEDTLGFLLGTAASVMRQALENALRPENLTASQCAVLSRLSGGDRQPISAVGERLGLDRPTMTGIVRRLEKKGLARRTRGTTRDRRIVLLELTDAGRQVMRRLPSIAEEVDRAATLGLGAAEQKQLQHLLTQVIGNMVSG